MSSTYRILCLSHDPALVTDIEWSSGTDNVAAVERAARTGVPGHEACDVLIGRWSGSIVEFGCTKAVKDERHACWHNGAYWVDVLWLRLLALARRAPEGSTERMLAARADRCWSPGRVDRLRHLLFPDES